MSTLTVAEPLAVRLPRRSSAQREMLAGRTVWSIHVALIATFLLLTGCGGGGGSDKTGPAQVRLLNVSPNYDSLDLFINDGTSGADTQKFSAVGYDTASAYTTVTSGTYAVKFRKSGTTTTLLTLSADAIAKDTHSAYVAYGSTGRFGVLKIGEDQVALAANVSGVQIVNASEAGSLDVYLTDAAVDLNDATALVGSAASGAVAGTASIDTGTYRLRVTGAGDKTDLRLDVSNVTLVSTKTSSLILTPTQGGVLVNAALVAQQGDVTPELNTQARLRGAVAISGGTTVNAAAGGVTLLSNAAVGVIGSKYAQVAAGNLAVDLRIDGTAVTIPTQTLTAGADYTLLFWTDTNGAQATLINDDNRLASTSGKVKLRMINGMSALNVPATLSIDFAPIAEGIAVGQGSDFTELDAGTDYQFDVTNTSTSASLLTRDSVTLLGSGTYTFFMWGNSTTASGTLRKDR
jgi:hypothetical protein